MSLFERIILVACGNRWEPGYLYAGNLRWFDARRHRLFGTIQVRLSTDASGRVHWTTINPQEHRFMFRSE